MWSSETDRCTIGSLSSCDLVIGDDAVSRCHCEIVIQDRSARIRDLGSLNGTVVDGVRVVDAYLMRDSLIRIGHAALRFRFTGTRPRRVSERTQFGILTGQSIAMRSVFYMLERAAASDATVLLEGESGTGKTAAARSLHLESRRKDGPFEVLDCATIPANLIESRLFGHVKGAFTGATSDQAGAFEQASGGTLFLDEIGELPGELQSKLLGVLESREVRPVGAARPSRVDVRIVAATNRDLRVEVNAARFREDLYYRLAVVNVALPPLRRRYEDLPALVEALVAQMGVPAEQADALISDELLAELKQAAWPGNIRQLRNYIERCMVLDEALPVAYAEDPDSADRIPVDLSCPFKEAKRKAQNELERMYIAEYYRMHKGDAPAAARAAGIERSYFYSLLRRHKIKE